MLVVGVSFSFFNWVDRLSFRILLTKKTVSLNCRKKQQLLETWFLTFFDAFFVVGMMPR